MKKYLFFLFLLSSYSFATKLGLYSVTCNVPSMGKHSIDILEGESVDTGCTAPLEKLEGDFSLSFTGEKCILTRHISPHTIRHEVAPENVTFILNFTAPDKLHANPYAKRKDMITLAEIYAFRERSALLDDTEISYKAHRAIKEFFNNASLEKCHYAEIEIFESHYFHETHFGLKGIWLVFFPCSHSN